MKIRYLVIGLLSLSLWNCASAPPASVETQVDPELPPAAVQVQPLKLPKLKLSLPFRKKTKRVDFWHIGAPKTHSFSLSLDCSLGTLHEPAGKEGLATVTVDLMSLATIKHSREDLIARIDGKSARLITGVNFNSSVFGLWGAQEDFTPLTQLLNEVIMEPRLDPLHFKETQEIQFAQALQAIDNPKQLAGMSAMKNYFSEGRQKIPTFGSPESLRSLLLEDAAEWSQRLLHCPQWRVTLTSPWPHKTAYQKTMSALRPLLRAKRSKPIPNLDDSVPPIVKGSRLIHLKRNDLAQTYVLVVKPLPSHRHPDFLPLLLGIELFGGSYTSRLNQQLRLEKALTYAVDGSYAANRAYGYAELTLSTRADQVRQTIDTLWNAWKELATEGPTEQELIRTKNRWAGQYPFQFQVPAQQLQMTVYYDWLGWPKDTVSQLPSRIDKISRATVAAALRRHFSQENVLVILVGPDSVREQMEGFPLPFKEENVGDYLKGVSFEIPHQ